MSEETRGIDRRKLLKIGATTAWVAPAVLTTLASPAAAASSVIIGTPCSYVLIVYKNNTTGVRYITALQVGSPSCVARDTVSGDVDTAAVDSALCDPNYSFSGNQLRYNGAPIATEATCRISYVGQTISIAAGFSILLALDHNGTHSNCTTGSPVPGEPKTRFTCSTTGLASVKTCCG